MTAGKNSTGYGFLCEFAPADMGVGFILNQMRLFVMGMKILYPRSMAENMEMHWLPVVTSLQSPACFQCSRVGTCICVTLACKHIFSRSILISWPGLQKIAQKNFEGLKRPWRAFPSTSRGTHFDTESVLCSRGWPNCSEGARARPVLRKRPKKVRTKQNAASSPC